MDIADFNALHMPALERNEVRHNLLLGLMQPSPDPADEMRRWTLGGAGACAIQTNVNRSIILGELDERQCHALAGQVYGSAFAGALGTENTAHWFVARAIQLGLSFGDAEPQMIHELREPPISPGAPGNARRATSDDLGLVFEWMTAFHAEAVPDDPPVTQEEVARKINERVVLFWETGGERLYGGACPCNAEPRCHRARLHTARASGARLCRIGDGRRGGPHFCVRQDDGLFVYKSAQSLFQPLLCKNWLQAGKPVLALSQD